MAPTRISIDLTGIPQKIGGLVLGRYIVAEGSKGLKLTGKAASTTQEEVVAILNDAVGVVKSFFGAPKFDAAVIVVPNDTKQQHEDDIISYGRGNGFNITQVIKEHTAVSAAYIEKVEPKLTTNLAIISLTGGFLDVSVVSIEVKEDELDGRQSHEFVLLAHKTHPEVIDLKDQKGSSSGIIGLIGGAAKELIVDPFENVLGTILKTILESPNMEKTKVDNVVLVGKASKSEKVRKLLEESSISKDAWAIWEGVDNPDDNVAYGAAYLTNYVDNEMPMNLPDGFCRTPEGPGAPK